MAARGDPGRPVHVDSDIPLVAQMRRAGVDADAHPDRTRGQPCQRPGRSLERSRRRGEGDKERVPLGIHLDPAVGTEGLAHDTAMLLERPGISLGAQLVQQVRRALHVGEEEGDGSGRKLAPHRRHHAPISGYVKGPARVRWGPA